MKGLKENFQKPHILIVGAGIIGKFNALELSELGYQITIVDPTLDKNSSSAALGLLMGYIYQKRNGRSWILRKQSLELWPKWIKLLQEFNPELHIEKRLIQLTTNDEKFEKLKKFVNDNTNQGLEILEKDSIIIKNINKIFKTKNIKGVISHKDGRIDPQSLLDTLNVYLKNKKINFLEDEIIKIKRFNKQWIAASRSNNEIKTDAIILCNSLNSINLIIDKPHKIKLKPVLGQALEICTNLHEVNLLSLPKHFNINGKNIIPLTKNKIIIGSTDEYHEKPEENVFEKLTDFIENKPSWLSRERVTRKWFGIRSRPEGEPSPIQKNLENGLIICTGFYKNGFLLAPSCSHWVANELNKYFI